VGASPDPTPLRPGNAGGGKGPWFKTSARSSEEREIGQSSRVFRSYRRRCMPKRRTNRAADSTRCTTSYTERMYCVMPTSVAVRTTVHPGSTEYVSRTSRRTALNLGSESWRRGSRRRRIKRMRSAGCISQSPTARCAAVRSRTFPAGWILSRLRVLPKNRPVCSFSRQRYAGY
jgi:hypothetical protein